MDDCTDTHQQEDRGWTQYRVATTLPFFCHKCWQAIPVGALAWSPTVELDAGVMDPYAFCQPCYEQMDRDAAVAARWLLEHSG